MKFCEWTLTRVAADVSGWRAPLRVVELYNNPLLAITSEQPQQQQQTGAVAMTTTTTTQS